MGVVPLKKNSFTLVPAVAEEWDFPFGLDQTADQGWAFRVVFSEQKVLLLEAGKLFPPGRCNEVSLKAWKD